jgi:hypothetical protein
MKKYHKTASGFFTPAPTKPDSLQWTQSIYFEAIKKDKPAQEEPKTPASSPKRT